jgi:hypothetical protein
VESKGTIAALGVDFGRVLNDGSAHPTGDDTIFLGGSVEEAMQTPAMEGAFDSLTRFNRTLEGRVWIVSKCGPKLQLRTEQWLEFHRFFEITNIDPSHLRFCRERSEKASHCKRLAITHFIDDRADVLGHLIGLVSHLYLFGPQAGLIPPYATPVPDWASAEEQIMATLT